MADQYPRSAWYDQTPPVREPAAPTPAIKKKRNRGLKVLILILCAVIVLAAVAYIATDGFNDIPFPQTVITVPNTFPRSDSKAAEDEEDGDYRSFFHSRYSEKAEQRGGSRVERTTVSDAPELTLQSAEGREELSLQELYTRCADSVVGIDAQEKGSISYAWGTGIVMSANGLILTNQHVIDECDSVTVVFADGTEYPAKLIGEDKLTDLALLKIEATGLTPAEFGDSSELRVGDSVAALGNPLSDSFVNSLTDGIISAIDRDVTMNGRSMTLLQTNAALNEGNSGGALLNRYGQVIGVTNMKMVNNYSDVTVEGIGFAIPTTTVKQVVDQLLAAGEVKGRPGLGITVVAISSAVCERYGIPHGLYVSAVSEGSDAEAKGIQPDDIIIAAEGEEIQETDQLLEIRNRLSVGDTLTLTVWRDGATMDIPIRIMDQNELY